MFYIPFEQLTENSLRIVVGNGYSHFILQRFEWSGVAEKVGFLLSPYDNRESALQHAHHLEEKEGKALELSNDADKIQQLLKPGSGYRIIASLL